MLTKEQLLKKKADLTQAVEQLRNQYFQVVGALSFVNTTIEELDNPKCSDNSKLETVKK